MTSTRPAAAFDEYAATYDAVLNRGLKISGESKEYFARRRVAWLADRLHRLNVHAHTMLEFGCGTASTCSLYFDVLRVEKLVGVDVSSGLLHLARQQVLPGPATFLLCDEYEPCAEADLAFCNGVFHHVPVLERYDAVSYVYRGLRPGGIFAFSENNPWNLGTRYVMSRIPFDRHAITLSPRESRRLLRNAGFRVLYTDFLFFFPRAMAWARAAEDRLAHVPLGAQYMVLCEKTGTAPIG